MVTEAPVLSYYDQSGEFAIQYYARNTGKPVPGFPWLGNSPDQGITTSPVQRLMGRKTKNAKDNLAWSPQEKVKRT